MVQGLGNDIIEISRIRESISRYKQHFLDRIFTNEEQLYCQKYKDDAPYYAGRFAAKEAVVKALGTGFRDGISWLDIEIRNDKLGKPEVFLSPAIASKFNSPKILISISHCREYAAAVALRLS
jgi:holo-[acyl-carrier protein] synthase